MDLRSQYEAYEASKRIHHIADEEDAKSMNIKVGDPYTSFPPPTTKEEAFERLEKYSGLISLEYHINTFEKNFPKNLRTLKDELKTLNDFIAEAEKISTVDAFKNVNLNRNNALHYEYLKWKYDYYKNIEFHNSPSFISANLLIVYGKYILYKKWIEDEIRKLTPTQSVSQRQKYLQMQKDLEKINPKRKITFFERIKRELNMMHWVFESQLKTKSVDMSLPLIHEDGRYSLFVHLKSNRRLSRIEKYKLHYTNRFENSLNRNLVENELIGIYKKAVIVRDYYNNNLTDANPLVKEAIETFKASNHSIELRNFRTMTVFVIDYEPQNILFGYDEYDSQLDFTASEFNYSITNFELVTKCQELIEFIDKFNIASIGNNEVLSIKDDLEVNIITRVEHPELFETTKENTIQKPLNMHPIHNPNLWNVDCYELFKYLFDNYYTNTKRQLTNIWFFLKENRNEKYNFYATKDNYKSFIFVMYNIKITNVDKADIKWEEKDLPKLKEHLANFEEHVKNT